MTEEIIINDVDVSGCCLYKDGICLTDKGKCTSMCDYGAYAREEELKKLKQENARLKETLEEIKDHTLDGCKRCSKNITSYCELCWVNNILSLCNEVLKDE